MICTFTGMKSFEPNVIHSHHFYWSMSISKNILSVLHVVKNMILILSFKKLDQMLGIIYLTFAFLILYMKSSSFFLRFFKSFALIELTLPCYERFLSYNLIFFRIVRFPHIFEKRYIKQLKDTITIIIIWWFVRNVVS